MDIVNAFRYRCGIGFCYAYLHTAAECDNTAEDNGKDSMLIFPSYIYSSYGDLYVFGSINNRALEYRNAEQASKQANKQMTRTKPTK